MNRIRETHPRLIQILQEMALPKIIPTSVFEDFLDEMYVLGKTPSETLPLLEKLVTRYEPDRPCFYRVECVEHGRCPRDPCCNN